MFDRAGKRCYESASYYRLQYNIGYNIIVHIHFLSEIAPLILYHQEWYNGQGYPEGLKGEEIPLGSRITSLINAYDAMTSDRPYRKSLGKEAAVEELIRGSGTQFDPRVVDVFVYILTTAEST
ncbi:MAG: hypothetical protein LBD57_03380 [Endomicrobium sp.]|uniref:HD-GYP domain-containing protein n=1 Tax=Candidatus Endomicrobiellum cubanum TaxID=3242325 RepID=UPI002825EAFB|nr:hypothetical protein [Endomicrobium sp.]